jgi:REP element-mobilizing transposase RayT
MQFVQQERSMSTLEYQLFYRRHLPHIQPPGATLFITFRLAGSIPTEVLQELRAEAERVEAALARIPDSQERAQRAYLEQRCLFGKWDTALDMAQSGPFWLRDPQIADLVAESLHHRDGRVYDLDAFCIMLNHVHVVYTPLLKPDGTYHAMSAIMHSLKRYTARQANLLLGREGGFWQHENYDHVVRDEAERQRIIMYVLNNPVKAGLVEHWEEWKWVYCKYFV